MEEAEDDNGSAENSELKDAWKRIDQMTERLYKEGFREGVSPDQKANEEILQSSFDEGYRSAFAVAKEFSSLQAAVSFRLAMCQEGRLSLPQQGQKGEEELDVMSSLGEELRREYAKLDLTTGEEDGVIQTWGDKVDAALKEIDVFKRRVDDLCASVK